MMSVLEYAEDVNKTVSEILNLCKRLNIPVLGEDDYLDEDAITELDNTIAREDEMDLEYVTNQIREGAGTQFDPEVANVMLNILENKIDKINEIRNKFPC